jgi:hypothetical protein
MRSLYLIPLAFLLQGCGGSTPSEPLLPPPSLVTPCAYPVVLPDSALNDQQIEVRWGHDRSALRECGSRHSALVDWVNTVVVGPQ